MKVSIIMPVYNERGTILKAVERVMALNKDKEIIIVNDGSTDGTNALLSQIKSDNVKIIHHAKNMGKGAALRTGFSKATGDIIAIQDADLEYDPSELKELIAPIEDGRADIVYGSRMAGGKLRTVYYFWFRLGNIFLTFLTNILFNSTLTDMETCYKVFKADLLRGLTIKSDDFTIEVELTAKLLKKHPRIFEVPISYFGRTRVEGKKITWIDGLKALFALFKYRFTD